MLVHRDMQHVCTTDRQGMLSVGTTTGHQGMLSAGTTHHPPKLSAYTGGHPRKLCAWDTKDRPDSQSACHACTNSRRSRGSSMGQTNNPAWSKESQEGGAHKLWSRMLGHPN